MLNFITMASITALIAPTVAVAMSLHMAGPLPYTALDFFTVPFSVPSGIAEIQVYHLCTDPQNSTNILDWGLADASGAVIGWGGGNIEPAIVGTAATSRSYCLPDGGTPFLQQGLWHVVVGKPRIASPPGHYSINVTLRDTPTLAPQPYRQPYVPSPPLQVPTALTWYAGDFHVHSRESGDAFEAASLDEVATYARDIAGLDFVVLTDHNTVSASSFIVDAQSRHPALLLLPGVEYTTYSGHAGAIFVSEYVDHRIGLPNVTIQSAAAAVHAQGGLFSINHFDTYEADPNNDMRNACVGCDWAYGGSLSAQLVDAMEVGIQGWNGIGWTAIPRAVEWWDRLHALGHTHIAPIGGSDDHHGGANETTIGPWREGSPIGSPATMVLAANLSHAAIREAIEKGRTCIKLNNSSDPSVDMIATVGVGVGDVVRIGGSVAAGAPAVMLTVTVTASSTSSEPRARPAVDSSRRNRALRAQLPVQSVPSRTSVSAQSFVLALVRNNEQTFTSPIPSFPFVFNMTVPTPDQGVDRWRAEIHYPDEGASVGRIVVLCNHIFLPSASA